MQPEWISTKKRLPENEKDVIVVLFGQQISVAARSKSHTTEYEEKWCCGDIIYKDEYITHWMDNLQLPHEIPTTCPNCGHEYDARLHWLVCPNCGHETPKLQTEQTQDHDF